MLDLVTGSSRDCTGLSRRNFLRIGGLSALGLSLPGFFRLQTLAAADATSNRSPEDRQLHLHVDARRAQPS
jgi:hypothetical protein